MRPLHPITIDFEPPLVAKTNYNVGTPPFAVSGIRVTVKEFQNLDGTWVSDGCARVSGQNLGFAGGSGQEMEICNARLEFDLRHRPLNQPVKAVKIPFGNNGDYNPDLRVDVNLQINGALLAAGSFMELNGKRIGDILISVDIVSTPHGRKGRITLKSVLRKSVSSLHEREGNILLEDQTDMGISDFAIGARELFIDNIEIY